MDEYEIITEGQRSPKWVEGHKIRLRLHLIPFFGNMGLSEVNEDTAQAYRVYRLTGKKPDEAEPSTHEEKPPHKPPSHSTLHDEIGTARLVLQTAVRKRWLAHVPKLSPPYKTSGKIVHRPWLTKSRRYSVLFGARSSYPAPNASSFCFASAAR